MSEPAIYPPRAEAGWTLAERREKALRDGYDQIAHHARQIELIIKRGAIAAFDTPTSTPAEVLLSTTSGAEAGGENEEHERRRDAWSDFESEHLTDGGGHAAAEVYAACREAFDKAWPLGWEKANAAAFAAFTALAKRASDAGEGVREAWQELCERDDRTTPEEYPDMCLITRDELAEFMSRAALSTPATSFPDAEALPAGVVKAWMSPAAMECFRDTTRETGATVWNRPFAEGIAFYAYQSPVEGGAGPGGEPVYRITKRGAFVETEPLRAAFDMADGSHDLYAHPAPVAVEMPGDGRPNGWTEALALSFIASKKLDPDIGLFIDAFNEGAWSEIESEWSEFSEFVTGRAAAAPEKAKTG